MIDMGSARLGMIVAERLRRNRKITITTRKMVSSSVNCTSLTEARIVSAWSPSFMICSAAGTSDWNAGISRITLSTTSTVLVPG